MESQNRFYSSKLGFVGNSNAASSLRSSLQRSSPAHKQQQQNYFTSNYFGGGNSNRPQAGQFSSSQDRNPSTINNSSHLKTYQDGVNSRGSSYYSAVRGGDGGAGFSTPTTSQMFQHSTSSSTQHNNNYPHNSTRFSQESSLLNSNSSSLNSLIASSAGNILNNSNNSSKLKVNKKDRKKYSLFSSSSSADLLESSGGAVSANSNSSAASVDLIPENQQLLEWIDRELDLRGIDSVVYGRYILSLLHSSSESLSNSSDSGETSSSSITVGSDVGGSITDQDSGYGPAITSNKSVFNKPNQNPPLPSWSSSAQSGTSRYCDFHQRLYPGFNLHQSRTKLLRSETKSLNTQKPSSTTKFMHKRYQNGRSGSPVSELFGAPDADECYFGGGSHNCPDCALRNNHGSVAHSTLSVKENNLTSHKPSPTLDYRKTVLRDCLRDASEQDSPNIESFVDELVNKFDSIRSQHQQPPFEISNPLRHLLSNQSESSSTATNSVKSYEATSEMDDFSVPSASGTRRFIKSFPNQSFNNNKSTNSSFVNNQNKPFNHSRSFDQSIQNNRNSSLPPAQESNASDSNSIAGSGGQWSQSQQNGPNAYRNNRTFQQSKFYRSLSDENAPKDDTISTASDSQKKGESKITSLEDSSPSSAKPSPPTNREQALKYFTAFPALSGGFMGSSLGKTSAVSSRSASTTRPSLSSSLSSPKSSSAKMSAQSSLDDSVFGDQPNNATLSNAVDSGDGSSNKASWNGMKIIKNVIKSSGISALASLNAPEPSSSSSSSTSSMAVITTKPPTLSGKSRNLIVAAPSSLFDLSRDSSNFTTLKKKISTGSGGSNSVSALSMVRKSSSTTSSSFETEDTLSDAKQPQASNLATNSTNSAGSSTTSMVTTREQEKIFNIMPSFLNPLKSSSSGSSGSVRSSITSTTTSVTSTTMTTLSSSTNTTSSSAVKKTTSAIGPTRYQQSAPHNSTTSFAFTSTSSSFVQADARNRSGSNGRIVRPLTSNYASNSRTENQSSSLMSVNSGEYGSTTCITSSTQASQAPPPSSLTVSSSSPASSPAVDLLPSFLKKNSTLATSSCSSASSTTGNISKAPYHHSSYRNGNNNSMATTASSSTALTEEKLSNNCSYYDEDEGIVNAASTTFATTDALEDAVWRSKTNSTNVFSTGKSSSLYGSTAYQHHFYQQPFHNHQQQQQSYHRVEEDIVNRAGVLESQAPVRSQQRHHESINNSSSSHKLKTSSVSASSTVNHLTNKVRSSSDEVDHSPFGVVITSGSMATSTVTSSSSSNTYAGPATAPGNLTRTTSVDARRQLSAAAAAVTTTGTNLSNNDSSRLLNDYWFNFTNQDDAAACGDARDERDATQDDPPLVEARTNNQFELSNDKSVTNNNNKCSPDEANKDNARIDSAFVSQEEANSSGTASNQTLVIDNKEMLDQLMNSILQKQKQRRHQHQQHKQQNNSSGQAPGTNQQQQQQQQQSTQPEHNFTIPTQPFSQKSSSIESRSNPSPSDKDSSAGSIQSFLDSIARSDSFGTDACWRPLNDSAMDGIGTTMDDFGSIAKSRDFVSYYWNQNCTLRWMNFAEDCNAPVGSQPSQQREPELAESELPKSYEDYVKQQNDFRQEISFLSDLFNKHKKQESQMNHDGFINPFAQSINAIVSNTSQQQQQHRDDSPSQRRISLVNHESESSAFQEVSTTIATPTRSELLIMLQDLNTDQSNKADSQSGRIDSPAFQLASSNQYFQPIEPDELAKSDLNLGDFDWTPLLQQNSKQANATTDASSTTNSTSYSRSISVSRAELEAYFTPLDHSMASLGTTTVGTCDSSAVPSATSFGDVNVLVTSATFYSSTTTTMTTSCPSRDSTAAVPATLTTNSVTSTDYFSAHNDKMSNSNCACKKSCNGHFLESACCCYPDEYHCRVGLVSPPEARMCDKSTTTELLEAVNASLGFIGNKQQQTTFTDDKMKQQAISSPLLDDLMKLFTTASTVANQQPQHHHIDDDELNVTDLVNDVLRLTVTAQQGGQLSPLNDFTNAFSTFTSTVKDNSSQVEAKHSIQPSEDIFDGPPMPYSKRKKFQNNKNMVYGQFPISSDEMQELRLLSQKQQLKPKSFEPKRNSKNSSISRPSNAMPNGTSSVDHSYFAYSHHDESQHQNNYESPDSGENNHDDGPSAEYNGYGDYHEDSAGGYYDDQAGEPNAASDYADHYMVGPDGAQYYVDTDDPGGGGGTYSPEELFAQYGTDAYAMMNSTMDDSNKNSVYPLFDLKFKSDNRTIDTIEVPKQNQKPCTFYMEGFCARGDCKFSHDLSSITCKYWQEGFCIKEEFCPFLHGYPESRKILPPVEHSKLDPNAKSFQFKIESDFDFPALAGEDDEFGLMESDSGLGPTVPGINASSESLQQYLTSNGSNSNNYRVNFQMMKSASKQPKPKFVNGSVNGHYNASRHSEQQNNQRQGTDEEWPSLNGGALSDSMLNGDSAKNNHSQEQYGAGSSSSSSSYNEHRVNYREKVTKNNKKNKYRFSGGSDRSGSNSANTSGNNNASSSATTKYGVTLKGFL